MAKKKLEKQIPYTLRDILKYRKSAYLVMKIGGGDSEFLKILATNRKPLSGLQKSAQWRELCPFYKPFLPGLSKTRLFQMCNEFCLERNRKQAKREACKPLPPARLRVLPENYTYDDFAAYVWEKGGRPAFGKRKVSGVKWGNPLTNTNMKTGWDRVILSRLIGCEIATNIRGKKFLKLSTAD